MTLTPPNILRSAYAELVCTDLDRSRWFYADVLGLVVTAETDDAIYLKGFDEFLHHSLVLRRGDVPALGKLAFRLSGEDQLQIAADYYRALSCPVRNVEAGTTLGIGAAVQVQDPLGYPIEFFYESEHTDRMHQQYHLQPSNALTRLDHFNVTVPDPKAAQKYYLDLGFRLSESIEDGEHLYAAWLFRKPTTHDLALTSGDGPRLHHIAFSAAERDQILNTCDILGAYEAESLIERGPGRHGVTNAFYLYLRDPDGHRIELYTADYYTGDPDLPPIKWHVTNPRRRSWWGHDVRTSWFDESSTVLDLDGQPVPIRTQVASERAAAVGADGLGGLSGQLERTS
ncbi:MULTISPECIES: 3,4-dihydroxyphenylacetate 2,3-dioxygenase [unclassified Microbacterium]|uniref:3,4-dihydroxyphenylacetate 2,3-dioxygenase n=1 Tax=unclassified Microbacterium TaxID=2609290 RepID=UPI000EA87ECD|nr:MULTISPECIES: 3,4-dihydroxyphenylacetate 2,3-dioxygenase [unclassified Microbacterium]MBT2486539.1 3,4-dihydroxyphenylacetate 2,3-dioxygenase [Microbacterium sp. ISL-108]RKN69230.1 3,4-dihydroxyphenylacetate 2,3-dioxygenase [Microbacterium sp. CGR2]